MSHFLLFSFPFHYSKQVRRTRLLIIIIGGGYGNGWGKQPVFFAGPSSLPRPCIPTTDDDPATRAPHPGRDAVTYKLFVAAVPAAYLESCTWRLADPWKQETEAMAPSIKLEAAAAAGTATTVSSTSAPAASTTASGSSGLLRRFWRDKLPQCIITGLVSLQSGYLECAEFARG